MLFLTELWHLLDVSAVAGHGAVLAARFFFRFFFFFLTIETAFVTSCLLTCTLMTI